MKKRFKNILIRNRKKNGISILICAVILSITLGMLVGCSVTKENTKKKLSKTRTQQIKLWEIVSELDAAQTDPLSVDNPSADHQTLENTMTFTFSKEGEQEQKQATLAIGDGYSFYLPDDEQWYLSAPDLWKTNINEQVTLWVTHFEGESEDSVNQKLKDDGYTEEDSYTWRKQEGDLLYHAEQKVFENDVWAIFYLYPVDFEEGMGARISCDCEYIRVIK